jgi:hypothetical protein
LHTYDDDPVRAERAAVVIYASIHNVIAREGDI